ncbi:hypothetical protein DMO16_03765 [Fictibacillus sp. S7]|nr:hypothetical protein DMO16_03765 [Fictibacillus sp. S7]
MIIKDTGLSLQRTQNLVVISMVSKTRTKEQKERLYSRLAERLQKECGISPQDLMFSITENGAAEWSFGRGEAQFLTVKFDETSLLFFIYVRLMRLCRLLMS